jgi:Ca2+:H+ antiporter
MAYALLLCIPLSLALRYLFDAPAGWVFLTGAAAIAVLADWLRRATDQLAERAGSTIGGLLNISFGNTAELILALFVLSRAHARIVQAQITGSIIGTTLLFFGISALVGGLGRVRQTFSQASAGLLSTLLFLVVVAILLPAVFDLSERPHPGKHSDRRVEPRGFRRSCCLRRRPVYTLFTHRGVRRRCAKQRGPALPRSECHGCRHSRDRSRRSLLPPLRGDFVAASVCRRCSWSHRAGAGRRRPIFRRGRVRPPG